MRRSLSRRAGKRAEGRLVPISRVFGLDRGQAIDRYYIERFLTRYASDIRGRVLEIGDDTYTKQFGQGRVIASEVLHVTTGNPKATLVADLSRTDQLPSNVFDSIICTQTLQFIYDVHAALATLHRTMKPGGTLLATLPGISQLSRYDMERWGEYWRFSSLSIRRLFEERFARSDVAVAAHGNVFVATKFLQGFSANELSDEELAFRDPDYEVVITARAVKQTS